MFYALILSALGPFIINTFLIDWSFMPDQAKYLRQTQSLRYLDFYQSEKYSVYVPSLIFSFFLFLLLKPLIVLVSLIKEF